MPLNNESIRAYLVFHADTAQAPTPEQWDDLFGQAKTYPLATAIRQAARDASGQITHGKLSQHPDYLNRYNLAGFEIWRDDKAAVLAVANAQAALRGITGTQIERAVGVLLAEFRDAAGDLGYGAGAQAKLTIPFVTWGSPQDTIAEMTEEYLPDNAGIWYEPEPPQPTAAKTRKTRRSAPKTESPKPKPKRKRRKSTRKKKDE